MYRLADKLLEQLKKLIRREFNRLGIFGFDELNAPRVSTETMALYERLMRENEKQFLKAAQKAYADAVARAIAAGYIDPGEDMIDDAWLRRFLGSYNFVSGYLYKSEAERKRLRLAEQMMTANLAARFARLGALSCDNLSNPAEAQRLIDKLLSSENPEDTCAGKKIISIMPTEEIDKRF